MHDLASHVFYSFTVTLWGMFTYFLYFLSSENTAKLDEIFTVL